MMQIVVATQALSDPGGSESYAITVADHLQRLGHDVWLHTLEPGATSEQAERLGLRVVVDEADLPDAPDVLLVQDGVVAYRLAASRPQATQVFVAHSDIFDLQLPPQLPGMTAAVVTLYDRVDRRIRALAVQAEVVRLTQPIDVERFKPVQPLRDRPRIALMMGNYLHGARMDLLRRACDRAGIELRAAGGHVGGPTLQPELRLNEADIVFGKARVIYEAMACGRAAYVIDHNGAEGWVTAETYPELAADNFGGQSRPQPVDEETLARDLAAYNPSMGLVNRDLAVAHHSATKHAAALVEVLTRVVTPRAAVPGTEAALGEMARLVRMYHRADAIGFVRLAETERLGAMVHDLEHRLHAAHAEVADSARIAEGARAEVEAARAEVEAARAEVEAARAEAEAARAEAAAHAADAAEARRALSGVAGSRRWLAVQRALGPADRWRAARRSRRTS